MINSLSCIDGFAEFWHVVDVTWVMHTKSTPRDDSARLVAGRQ
jgi:hypothetical protein